MKDIAGNQAYDVFIKYLKDEEKQRLFFLTDDEAKEYN